MAVEISVFVIVIGLAVAAFSIGYFVWRWTHPKKMSWMARIYTLGEGVREKDVDGDNIPDYKLSDLRPYMMDTLTRDLKDHGVEVYTLKKLGKTTPSVTEDVVEIWGDKIQIVNVLYHGGSCTLLKKGYAKDLGEMVWHPMSYDRTNALMSDMTIRKERRASKKDLLASLAPYFVTVMMFMALIAMVVMQTNAAIKMEEQDTLQAQLNKEAQIETATLMRDGLAEYGTKCVELSKVLNERIPIIK